MNFKLPFFDEPANFCVVVGAMVVLAIGILARRPLASLDLRLAQSSSA